MDTIVLKYDKAKEWLFERAKELLELYDGDSTGTAETIEELLEYVNTINDKDWEYVMIEECPMAVSGITIYQMVVKE